MPQLGSTNPLVTYGRSLVWPWCCVYDSWGHLAGRQFDLFFCVYEFLFPVSVHAREFHLPPFPFVIHCLKEGHQDVRLWECHAFKHHQYIHTLAK